MYRIIAIRDFGDYISGEYYVKMQRPFLGTCWTPEFSEFLEDAKSFKSFAAAEECLEGIQSFPYFLRNGETKAPEYLIVEK